MASVRFSSPFRIGASTSPSVASSLGRIRASLARTGDWFRVGAVSAFWAVHMVAVHLRQEAGWMGSLPPWHLYLLLSFVLLALTHRWTALARRSVWLVPLFDMPMVFWIESLHAPQGDPPAAIAGFTAGGFVLLVLWSALGLDARLTMTAAVLAGIFEAKLFHSVGGSPSAMMASVVLMMSAGFLTVVTTRSLGSAMHELVEAQIRRQEAERAARDKDRFISTVSHDFRTPLAVILAALQSLQAEPELPGEVRQDFLARAIRQCRRVMMMTEDLLRLARLGAQPPRMAPTDVAALARETVRALEPRARREGVHLEGPEAAVGIHLRADANLIERALANLVDNAIRHASREVSVSIDSASDAVHLAVADDGDGLPSEELDRVFEPFYRADRRRAGTGLGLAIVREVAHVHGGRATVSSAEGAGCVFSLVLPYDGGA